MKGQKEEILNSISLKLREWPNFFANILLRFSFLFNFRKKNVRYSFPMARLEDDETVDGTYVYGTLLRGNYIEQF